MKEQIIEKIIEKYLLWEVKDQEMVKHNNPFVGKYVIVRWYNSWVRCGKLIDPTLGNIILEDARNLWRRRCKKSIGLSWLASYWLADKDEVKVLETQKKIVITDTQVSTLFPVWKDIEKQLRERPTAIQS